MSGLPWYPLPGELPSRGRALSVARVRWGGTHGTTITRLRSASSDFAIAIQHVYYTLSAHIVRYTVDLSRQHTREARGRFT